MITKISFFISTLVLVMAGTAAAGDGTTKPAVQARQAEAQTSEEDCDCACASTDQAVTTTEEVEQPVNTSYSSEVIEDNDVAPASNVDTGTKPAARALQRAH